MQFKRPYKDINDTLHYLKVQVVESIPFAYEVCPAFENPEQLFNWLKKRVKYRNDPKGVELLQTMQTMFLGKFWGVPGAGDCDCFVITTLACMISQGWENLYIALVGRKKRYPVHIYVVIEWKGERKVFDLTNPKYGQERQTYNYIQEIPVPWENWN